MVRFDGALVEERLLETVADALSSRGPDGRNLWKQNNIGGCFTWMKTGPAKQASQQPVIWGNRYWLWGDIRLDGKAELLQQIEGNGNPGNPDRTSEELLLHAWER